MRRETQHVLLLLVGGALLRIAVDDTYLRYVRPSHRWLLVGAGVVVLGLAVVAMVSDLRGHPAGARTGRMSEPHPHGRVERYVPWLLLAPVLVIALVAPPALGADAVARAGTRNLVVQDADVFGPLAEGAPLTVAEFVQRAVRDSTGSLEGRVVTLTGFAVRDGAATGLARLTIACCAADARANRVRLLGDLGVIAPDTWLRVRGTVQSGTATAATGYVPAMTVTTVDVVAAPTDPYEY